MGGWSEDSQSVPSTVFWTLGAVLTILSYFALTLVLRVRPVQSTRWYQCILHVFAFNDITFGIISVLMAPLIFIEDSHIIVVGQGVLGGKRTGGVLLFLFTSTYSAQVTILATTFAYRYCLLARPKYQRIFQWRWVHLWLVFLCGLEGFCLAVLDWLRPTTSLTCDKKFHDIQSDMESNYYFASDLKVVATDPIAIGLISIIVAKSTAEFTVIILCGFGINSFITRNSTSRKTASMHGTVLRMLILQALNPTFFNFFPALLCFIAGYFDIRPLFLAVYLIALHSMNNPLIVIAMTNEYRQVFAVWGRRKKNRTVPGGQ